MCSSHVLSEERKGTHPPHVSGHLVLATGKGANNIHKAHTWAKPCRLSPILPMLFRIGSNVLPRFQPMTQELNRMCVLVCLVPEYRKKISLLTGSFKSNWYVSTSQERAGNCSDGPPFSSAKDLSSTRVVLSAILKVCPSLRP